MILDAKHDFGIPAITTSNTATKSPHSFNAGAAVKLFAGPAGEMKVRGKVAITAGTSPTITVRMIASDEEDLDVDNSEASNDVLGEFFTNMKEDGSAVLANGDSVNFEMPIQTQKVARQHYGLHVILDGTSPSCAAGETQVVRDAQTNMLGPT